jgi:hypothetical protein
MLKLITRKSVENNPIELLVALLVTGQSKVNPQLVTEQPEWLLCEDYEKYKKNLLDFGNVESFISSFLLKRPIEWTSFTKVHLTGKKQFNHPILIGLDRKITKSDVYIENPEGKLIGISVKQSQDATKTNYSVEKMLNELGGNGKRCKEIRKTFLAEKGFPKHDKTKRDSVNKLFYDRFNPYYEALREEIYAKNTEIKNKIVNYLHCCETPIPVWEFNGETLKLICIPPTTIITFEEYVPYYTGTCAKMFYKLTVGEEEYRVEIRSKGNWHTASVQFQVHTI